MQNKALLFVNGEPPASLPTNLDKYTLVACTDGAYHSYLQPANLLPDYLVGDLDSLENGPINSAIEVIHTPDQNKTDFEKTLLFLMQKGITAVDIYGASGRASDHFLGNLSVAVQYQSAIKLTFYDNYGYFFLAEKQTQLIDVKDKTISLLPFGFADNVTLVGFEFPLTNAKLSLGGLTSLRNHASESVVNISFTSGDLLVFVCN